VRDRSKKGRLVTQRPPKKKKAVGIRLAHGLDRLCHRFTRQAVGRH